MNKIVLCGNPNTGKTTIFNALTYSRERVGNFHGVTVDKKEKEIMLDKVRYCVVDLPGLYSLNSATMEEEVAVEYIKNLTENDIILYIVDESKLRKNLYLYTQLKEIGYKIILCINRIEKGIVQIDYSLLDRKDINYIIFSKKSIKKDLLKVINRKNKFYMLSYLENSVKNYDYKNLTLQDRFYIIRNAEKSEKYQKKVFFSKENHFYELVNSRYNYIKNELKSINYLVKRKEETKIKKLFTGKLVIPIFIICIIGIFLITFGTVGKFFTGLIEEQIFKIFNNVRLFMVKNNFSSFFIKFLTEGVYLGVSVVINFLPQLFILFVCIAFLEESGYISSLCFVFDDYLEKFGLSGKNIFTLLMCFGCSTTACYQTRTNQNVQSKIKCALMTPYLPCSAKIPIMLLLTSVFFRRLNILILLGLYAFGIFMSFFSLSVINKVLDEKEPSFILEVPSLKIPSLKNILFSSFKQILDFLVKIGSLIMVFNIFCWIAVNCDFRLHLVDDLTKSILYNVGDFFSFILKPLGFGSAGITSALICGIVAKEIIVSSFGIFNAYTGLPLTESILLNTSVISFTSASAISFLVFALLYCPCLSNYIVIKKEIGEKWATYSIISQFLIAYTSSFIVYTFINIFKANIIVSLIILIVIIVLMVAIYYLLKKLIKLKN